MPFCIRCGAEVYPDARFCTSCGMIVILPSEFGAAGEVAPRAPGGSSINVYTFALAEREGDPNYSIDFFEVELTGAPRYAEAFARVMGPLADEEERLLDDVPAVLVLQSEGLSGAEVVDVDARAPLGVYQRIGRLAPADATEYAAVIAEMKRRTGMHVGCLARISGKGPSAHYTRPHYSALVYLPGASEWHNWKF